MVVAEAAQVSGDEKAVVVDMAVPASSSSAAAVVVVEVVVVVVVRVALLIGSFPAVIVLSIDAIKEERGLLDRLLLLAVVSVGSCKDRDFVGGSVLFFFGNVPLLFLF